MRPGGVNGLTALQNRNLEEALGITFRSIIPLSHQMKGSTSHD
jgi:hypothetical protein